MESPHTLVQPQRERGEPPQEPARHRITNASRGAACAQELVRGRYRTLEQLGSGGFGVVWRAHDELLHREVALKRVSIGSRPIDGERASREALATARLAHPAIVALHEAFAEEDAFYLISELVDGDTLARLIAEDALEDEEVVEIGLALASALVHAHARGVIHRDIKPQNVLVPHPVEDRRDAQHTLVAAAKLTDFGGASLVGEDALTRTGDVLGTLAYMSPEQSEGREAGPQSDLYSLALVIYEALSGVNPVRGATPAATARRIGQQLPPLARERRDLPRSLTAAVDRALASAPAARGSLEQLRHSFEQTLTPRRDPRSQPPPHERTATHELPHADSAARPRRLALGRAVLLGGAAALIIWQALAGRPGVALLVLAAALPLVVLSGPRAAGRAGAGWLTCALTPALGYVGLAGAFPAIAGQAARWRERAAVGALGFWWLQLAGPLLDTRLWLPAANPVPARAAWEGSLSVAGPHVVFPLFSFGVLLGVSLWAAAAAVLPWLVRGRSATRDVVAVAVWTAAIVSATPTLDAGLDAHALHPDPRGLLAGAIVGALLAVAARALRGPV
ncbi:MAG TPA: serine/threonine-protein kinase [Solirubrobacteraceae bacterium]|nr:serine/threonine-protein kinase [Solirubrobacteraceae bacterium]